MVEVVNARELTPSGSGKSTLFKTMAPTLRPHRGTVRVSGTASSLLEWGMAFQPELTGQENVFLSLSADRAHEACH
jgi:ABC-type polysaccharide/polyol phosphate transport system ATPase subunit